MRISMKRGVQREFAILMKIAKKKECGILNSKYEILNNAKIPNSNVQNFLVIGISDLLRI